MVCFTVLISDGEKTLIICLAVSTEYRCDRRTDGQTAFNSIVRGVERLCKAENQKAESQQAEFKRQKIKWQINQKAEKTKGRKSVGRKSKGRKAKGRNDRLDIGR